MQVLPRILVVDDDPISQKVAAGILEKLGYPVDIAASGRAAVEAAAQHDYALIFMDCRMKDGDGFWATGQIRQLPGNSAAAAIIALTVLDDEQACLRAGMDGYLQKPARLSQMVRVVNEWLGNGNSAAQQHA